MGQVNLPSTQSGRTIDEATCRLLSEGDVRRPLPAIHLPAIEHQTNQPLRYAGDEPVKQHVIPLEDLDHTQLGSVGGKGAHLGELCRLDGINVPRGFCVSTAAYEQALAQVPSIDEGLERLRRLDPDDRVAVRTLSGQLRHDIEQVPVPSAVASAVTDAVRRAGDRRAFAVRSSATAEDLPASSFAGQHDTYLNVVGLDSVLEHLRRCWASLFTERAVSYRLRAGIDHRDVKMAVLVQQLVDAQSAGVVFTADPVSSNRTIAVVEATLGLGESLVSGHTQADVFKVRNGRVIAADVVAKQVATYASPGGGTQQRAVESRWQAEPALTEAQVVHLVRLCRRIEEHFGRPQDIEWCWVDGDFHFVQSRPITTLFPIPTADDEENRVYISVGHQQMMTDAMKPLGLSLWLLTTRAPMREAGGRLFVDVTQNLASPASRAALLQGAGRSDPLIEDALQQVLDRADFIRTRPTTEPPEPPAAAPPAPIETDPSLVAQLVERSQTSLAALQREIHTKTGPELFDFILADLQELQRILFEPRSYQVIMAAIEATWWLNEHLWEWLGEKNAADALAQSAPGNVTSEMGLALMDVADAIRPHPDVVAFLRGVEDDGFLDELLNRKGGRGARDAIQAYLDKYGMRCVGEIDISRPRWSERPTTLLPLILNNVAKFEPGAAQRHFERGQREASRKERDLLERLQALPEGKQKAEQTKQRIDRLRTFAGYREYPKYTWMSRYFAYKQALLAEAERLVKAQVLRAKEDIFFLRFDELHDVVRTQSVDDSLISQRKQEFRSYEALMPPRVITSDGEILSGTFRRENIPSGALVGTPASSGTIEGRARVLLDITDAHLEPGDILVTVFTDPSWTPLFVAVGGLVTEVGGTMTHGAVIAREYGLPTVVGVDNATRRIRDGQRIRVNGTDGYIEILT